MKNEYWHYENIIKIYLDEPEDKKNEPVEYKKEIQLDKKIRVYVSKYDDAYNH